MPGPRTYRRLQGISDLKIGGSDKRSQSKFNQSRKGNIFEDVQVGRCQNWENARCARGEMV